MTAPSATAGPWLPLPPAQSPPEIGSGLESTQHGKAHADEHQKKRHWQHDQKIADAERLAEAIDRGSAHERRRVDRSEARKDRDRKEYERPELSQRVENATHQTEAL
jgi:hypothetical protein